MHSVDDNTRRAMLLLVGFAMFVTIVAASAKALGEGGMAAPEITWVRFAMQAIVAPTLLLAGGRRPAWPRPAWMFLVRGLLIATGSVCLYAGLAFVPMADSTSILFIAPLLLTALSAPVLGEHVGPWRWAAVLAGFCGAVLVAGPNFAEVGPAAALPVVAATLFASAQLLTRRYRAHGSALEFQFTTAVTGITLISMVLVTGSALDIPALTPRWPTAHEVVLLLLVGIVGTITNLMMTQALRTAPPSVVAPFLYLEVVSAAAAGYLVFGDVPREPTVIGTVLVVAAGLVVWWRELRRNNVTVPPTEADG